MCAFPLHFWTLLLAFRDISWLTERSNLWDAIGVVSYGMVFAFLETVVIFLIAALLGFLVSRCWDKDRRIALLSILVLIISLWAIISQLYVLMGISVPDQLIIFLPTRSPVKIFVFDQPRDGNSHFPAPNLSRPSIRQSLAICSGPH